MSEVVVTDGAGQPTAHAMARSLGALYVCGAALAIVWTLLPHQPRHGEGIVIAMACVAATGGIVMLGGTLDGVNRRVFHGVIMAVQLVITIAFVACHAPTNDIRLFYVWATPFAGFFFRPLAAVWHTLWSAALLGAGLAVQRAPFGPALRVWLMTSGTMVAVGMLVVWVAGGVRRREVLMRHAATHDPLTGLPNRVLFGELARTALARRLAQGGNVFVVLADLDRFKVVNDTHGHHAGDQLLVALAPRLRSAAPPGATVARMGGDEFAVLVDDPAGVLRPPDVLERLRTAWAEPIVLERGTVYTSACLGLAVATDGDTSSSLLRDADAAMYDAKRAGSDLVQVFDTEHRAAASRRYQLEQALHTAVREERLHLLYQPVVSTSTGELIGAEALLRWDHPTLGPVGPNEFIPIAEETGLITSIGTWVLERVVAQISQWLAEDLLDDRFQVGVNVSAHQLDDDLPATIERFLLHEQVPGSRLVVEVTESALIERAGAARRTLSRLRDMGIHLSLDDFGTGFSSLSSLRQAHFDSVKVDRTFVRDMDVTAAEGSLVAAIMALAGALRIDVVAEGVETSEQAAALCALGCRVAQGYLYDPPLALAQLERRLVHVRGRRVDVVPVTTLIARV